VIVIGNTSTDSDDNGILKKKVPGMQHVADSMKMSSKTFSTTIPLDSKTDDSSPYNKMEGWFHHSTIYVSFTRTLKLQFLAFEISK
jgi:hypothetical protein